MPSRSAISASGWMTENASTLVSTFSPSASCSVLNPVIWLDMFQPVPLWRPMSSRPFTKEPDPRRLAMRPWSTSSSMAFLTVILLTSYCSQSSSVVGSWSLGLNSPFAMRARTSSATISYLSMGNLRSFFLSPLFAFWREIIPIWKKAKIVLDSQKRMCILLIRH